jgi:hypothetical protein
MVRVSFGGIVAKAQASPNQGWLQMMTVLQQGTVH